MFLTVAICTYKRLKPLGEALASLAVCDAIDEPWELLVVDNEGDDAVRMLVESFHDRLAIRYCHEPNLGASHARNHAVRRAEAPIVLFTDDDVTFDTQWLKCMARAIRDHPRCAFWGGRVEPVWPGDVPRWFDLERCPMMGDVIVRYQRGDEPRDWREDEDPPFYTANLALRVEAVERAGYFDTSVGHRGAVHIGMEDSLMVREIASGGGRGWYAADAVVYHPVPAERGTKRYALRFARKQGRLSVYLLRRESEDGRTPRWLYRVAVEQLLKGLWMWAGGLVRFDSAQRFAGRFIMVFNGSKLYHAIFGGKQA